MDATTVMTGLQDQAVQPIVDSLGISLLFIIVIITIIKGVALYKSARLNEKVWFWVLLIFNTAGILPLIYLYIKRKRKI